MQYAPRVLHFSAFHLLCSLTQLHSLSFSFLMVIIRLRKGIFSLVCIKASELDISH